MSRIVITLQKTIDGPSQFFLEEPSRHQKASIPKRLNMKNAQKRLDEMKNCNGASDTVIKLGTELLKTLATHPAIKEDVLPLLDPRRHQEEAIYLFMKNWDPDLDQFPWEALHTPEVGFLSANKFFPIARAQDVALDYAKAEWTFTPPLKIMAILGAGGDGLLSPISAEKEWESLYNALRGSRLRIELQVLLCEDELKAKIDAQRPAWITTGLLHDRDQLFSDIRNFGPHILHFFCHGTANPTPQLDVGNLRNWILGRQGGIHIEADQLKQRADPHGNIWLVTLNCCESAQSSNGSGFLSMPMACSLVTYGFPVVVGMREKIAEDFAHDFCRLFYEALLDDFADRLDNAKKEKGVTEVHWACALFAARQKICEMIDSEKRFSEVAASAKEWTIPVIHTRLETFHLRLSTENDAYDIFGLPPAPPNGSQHQGPLNPDKSDFTGKELHQFDEEILQLIQERKRFENMEFVVRAIDAQLAKIEAELKA